MAWIYEYVPEERLERRSEQYVLGFAEGFLEGMAKALLGKLKDSGIPVDDQSRDRITSCTDIEMIETWIDRSMSAAGVADIFGD